MRKQRLSFRSNGTAFRTTAEVAVRSILGGLHHEYRLERIAGVKMHSRVTQIFFAEHKADEIEQELKKYDIEVPEVEMPFRKFRF